MVRRIPPTTSPDIQAQKKAIRRRVLDELDVKPNDQRRYDSRRIADQVLALESYQKAQTVLLFYPLRYEWDATLIIRAALNANKRVVLPRTDLELKQLVLHRVEDIEHDTEISRIQIREPMPTRPVIPAEALDWILAPGVAFTRDGCRLGHGAGYFDRLLAQAIPSVPVVSGAFEMQIVPSLPMEPHDRRVDQVITERVVRVHNGN
jgi:5-formyltetrahydrofolate cyclo-ligase